MHSQSDRSDAPKLLSASTDPVTSHGPDPVDVTPVNFALDGDFNWSRTRV